MAIQWSLVLFTVLTGLGGWMLAAVAASEFTGKASRARFAGALVALVCAAVGGIASVAHLSHPERMMEALNHPTSGIFVEAVLVGLMGACVIVYLVLLARDASASARKAFAVLGAVFGVALSFMAGYSYIMAARPVWDTVLLPLGYLGTAAPSGIAAYLALACGMKAEPSRRAMTALGVAGIAGFVLGGAYLVFAGAFSAATLPAVVCLAGSGIAPIVCGFAAARAREEASGALAATALVCAVAGSVAYRCAMWMISVPVADYLGTVL
ncbi:dimethyl sulfoxide reductase anchor subunit family protein [Rubneribacter sp.]|nr:dimethyl sulfoxide reductase anchor subunit [Candidatus Rubneribacter avistercoris]